jgi:hypothetical protein
VVEHTYKILRLDTYGHITGITSATETVVNTDTNTVTQIGISGGPAPTPGDFVFKGDGATTITQDGGSIYVTSTDTNTTYSVGNGGLTEINFTSALNTKLAGIAASANNYSLPEATATTRGGIELFSDTDQSIAANTVSATAGRTYGIQLNSAGQAVVNVPWSDTNTDTNTTYTADGNYGLTLSGTTFRLEDDRRRNSSTTDIYTGNTHDYTWYDADVGIRWYTAGAEEMRLQDDGTLHVDGDVVAYSTTVSDERLKDNVTTIQNPLDKIKALRGVEYEWNAGNRKGKRDLGLIAQEVEMVIPEIVHDHKLPLIDGESGTVYKTVDYEKMVAVLIEGMKEQQTQIESLKSEIDELKGKL